MHYFDSVWLECAVEKFNINSSSTVILSELITTGLNCVSLLLVVNNARDKSLSFNPVRQAILIMMPHFFICFDSATDHDWLGDSNCSVISGCCMYHSYHVENFNTIHGVCDRVSI
jgi:hypothetical protein